MTDTWNELRRRASNVATARDDLRVGDTERNEMAEVLTRHYSDGRLDETEFRERVDRAMRARTVGDLRGLTDDLPALGGLAPAPARPPRTRRALRTLAVVLVAAMTLSALGATLLPPHLPWVLLLVGAAWLYGRSHRRCDRSTPPG